MRRTAKTRLAAKKKSLYAAERETERVRAKLIYLPPYSPGLNPIEKCWSKIKTHLRKAKARTREELEKALREALLLITEEDAQGWFKSCAMPYTNCKSALIKKTSFCF